MEEKNMSKKVIDNRCGACRTEMAGARENVRYECGIDGVTLVNVMVYRCPNCGEREIEIPYIEKLHRAIALDLARQPGRLGPKEIRFLRTYLGLSSGDFARKIGVDKATVSRYERIDSPIPMGPQTERLLRLMVMSEKPVEEYPIERVTKQKPKHAQMRLEADKKGWHVARAA